MFEGIVRGTSFLKQYLCSCAGTMAMTLPAPPAHGPEPSCHCGAHSHLEERFRGKGVFKSRFILKSPAQMAEGFRSCHVWAISNKCAWFGSAVRPDHRSSPGVMPSPQQGPHTQQEWPPIRLRPGWAAVALVPQQKNGHAHDSNTRHRARQPLTLPAQPCPPI